MFLTELKKNESDYFCRYWFFCVFSLIFNENYILIDEDNPSAKTVIVDEKVDGIDRDHFANLETWTLVVGGGELTIDTNQKKKSAVLRPVDVQSVTTNTIYESISSMSIWTIVNQLGK